MANNVFVYWSDGLGSQAFGHHIRNEGRDICQQKLPAGPGIWQIFSSAWGLHGGLPGGMLAAAIDSHITSLSCAVCNLSYHLRVWVVQFVIWVITYDLSLAIWFLTCYGRPRPPYFLNKFCFEVGLNVSHSKFSAFIAIDFFRPFDFVFIFPKEVLQKKVYSVV